MVDLSDIPVLILAGGLGTRLQKVWTGPKCVVPLSGRPFIHWQLGWLEECGFRNILMLMGHKAKEAMPHLSSRRNSKLVVKPRTEKELHGTRAAVCSCAEFLKGRTVVVLNGDTLYDEKYRPQDIVSLYFRKGCEALRVYGYDALRIADGPRNAGFRVLNERVLRGMRSAPYADLEDALDMVDRSRVTTYLSDGIFYDVGTPVGVHVAEEFLAKKGMK